MIRTPALIVALSSVTSALLISCKSPPECPAYCGTSYPVSEIQGRCVTAFGPTFSVPRQCATVPHNCQNLTAYSPELASACPDGSNPPIVCCSQ